jgi:fumarylacetoacetase
MVQLNATHDPARHSWVESANRPDSDFPIQNLPFGIFRRPGKAPRGGVAIGDRIFDLAAGYDAGLFSGLAADAARTCAGPRLNPLMELGNRPASALRARLSDLLRADGPERAKVEQAAEQLLVPMAHATLDLPVAVSSFTDFMASIYHTTRGGRINRPDNPLPVNFKHVPIAYNSRASSVRASGDAVKRPNGQYRQQDGSIGFGPCRWLDFEMEVGIFIGAGNKWGSPIPLARAGEHIFGFCLLNDWSARDIQRWESAPLGPFLAKSVGTTISPWIVTHEAMMPFRTPAFSRDAGDPPPLPYLSDPSDQAEGGYDFSLGAYILTDGMRAASEAPHRICATNFRHLYWTVAQMVTHHASNGCNLLPGDLLGTGTVSGPTDDGRACMAEITVQGSEPIELPNGETRPWIADGDEVIFRARAERAGAAAIGFGECGARIEPAVAWPEA